MRPNGTLRTFAAGYRNELQQVNAQRKMQFASHLAGKFIDQNDGYSNKKTTVRSIMTGLHQQCQQRKSLSSSVKKSISKKPAPIMFLDHQSSWQQAFRAQQELRSDLPSPQSLRQRLSSSAPQCEEREPSSSPQCEEREPPADVSASDCYDSSSSSSDSGDLNDLDLSLQIDPEDDEGSLPCAQVSFDASETRDDDEISILSNGEQVDEFDLAIFQSVCDPFPDERVDYNFNRIPF